MEKLFCLLIFYCLSFLYNRVVFGDELEELKKHISRGYIKSHVRYPHGTGSGLSHEHGNEEHYLVSRIKPVNILMILADDLGYGDTSVIPFTGSGIKTPNLQRMAERGVVLTNFHSAATTCSPSRAAILTGMYPWRVGMKSVFEYGVKQSNRDDWLIQVPTAANLFADHNYSTFHSGKWHLGGMRNDDYDMRRLQDKGAGVQGSRRCPHPGPQQQGFQHYVSVLDGPGSPRQNYLQVNDKLYSEGCNYLLADDIPVTKNMFNITGYLSYCEARHAMRGMKEAIDQEKPFYIHLWFHAPHGPWETIPGYANVFTDSRYPRGAGDGVRCELPEPDGKKSRYCVLRNGKIADRGGARFARYATMVSDMDAQIGMVLEYIEQLGIEKDTLVFFTSDNGYEDDAGGAGGLRGNKRHIYEGGIRVPAIAQWVGTLPAGGVANSLFVNTDLLPTFADAAGIQIPRDKYHLDGISILPELIQAVNPNLIITQEGAQQTLTNKQNTQSSLQSQSQPQPQSQSPSPGYGILQILDLNNRLGQVHLVQKQKKEFRKRHAMLQERLILWHNDYEGPKRTVGIAYDYKFILNEEELPMEIYDLRNDLTETNNLLLSSKQYEPQKNFWTEFKNQVLNQSKNTIFLLDDNSKGGGVSGKEPTVPSSRLTQSKGPYKIEHLNDLPIKLTKSMISNQKSNYLRKDFLLTFHLIYRLYPLLYNYAIHGANGHSTYVRDHPEIRYPASPLSDQRPMASSVNRLYTPLKAEQLRKITVEQGSCPAQRNTCNCDVSTVASVTALPFQADDFIAKNIYRISINPTPFINATHFLFAL